MAQRPFTPWAEQPGGVGLIEDQEGPKTVGERYQIGDRGHVAVHAEHGLRDDQPARGFGPPQ